MKDDLQNVPKNCKRITSPAGIEDMNPEKMRDQESLPSSGMKIFFLATVMLAETFDINHSTTNSIHEITV